MIKRIITRNALLVIILGMSLFLVQSPSASAKRAAQLPTGSIPTVTGTPPGVIATVKRGEQDQINVRSGPATSGYDVIGVLIVGQQVPALGISAGGDWVLIAYPGVPGGVAWVYAPLVDLSGKLPVVEPPPTPTPRTTPTIDPTLAAQFLVDVPPTRLPTYTAPPPLQIPTFPVDAPSGISGRIPIGMLIVGMAILGFFGILITFLRGR